MFLAAISVDLSYSEGESHVKMLKLRNFVKIKNWVIPRNWMRVYGSMVHLEFHTKMGEVYFSLC